MDAVQAHTYVLILAGGGGIRLWPLSREKSPKQFLKLFQGKSLFGLTLDRAKKITDVSRIFISTSNHYLSYVQKNSPGVPSGNIIGEPMRRDTAMGMGLPALYIYARDPEAVIINLASDHLIKPVSIFVKDMLLAAKIASEANKVVTVGIKPLFPHIGMGHIKFAGQVGLKFIEKPPLELAKKFTASGNYYWNANLYVWKARLILNLLKKHSPKTVANFPIFEKSIGTDKEKQAMQQVFQMAPKFSIDFAVSEKMHNFICLPANFSWTDIGDWSEVYNNLEHDKLGNAIVGRGEFIATEAKNNLIMLNKKLISVIGLDNIIVIDTKDAILICNSKDDQAVKKVVQILQEKKMDKYL